MMYVISICCLDNHSVHTVKASFSPRREGGGLFNFRHFRGGLLEREAYSQNQMTRMYMIGFQFFYPIICGFNIQFYESHT